MITEERVEKCSRLTVGRVVVVLGLGCKWCCRWGGVGWLH